MPEIVNTSALTVDDETAEVEDSRPVMIDVDHVSMSFNMASEQLNNLKEYAIAIARGKLFFEEFKALDDVSFKVRKGDVFGIMGTNGSGKSTILKIIAGVLEPTKGKCTVNGNIAPLIELGAGFDMDLSARENIYLNGALLGYSKQFIDDHFQEIVEFAEVEKFLDMPLKNYSSGMVARIAFAIATVIVPEILVVDEVLSVGDFMFQKKCEDRITQLIEEYGVTVLIVSHSNDQIARLCNKAVWIEKGHVRLQGDADMVARIYGALGGRTGSKESEAHVFDAMLKSASMKVEKDRAISFVGENAISACTKSVIWAWGTDAVDDLVLVADNTHVNAAIANGFAGGLNAPILPINGLSELSDAVILAIEKFKPKRIFVFDVSGTISSADAYLSGFSWNPEVVYLGRKSVNDMSLAVFEYGKSLGLWSDEAYFATFDDNAESLAIGSLSYAKKAPVFIFDSTAAFDELSLNKAFASSIRRGLLLHDFQEVERHEGDTLSDVCATVYEKWCSGDIESNCALLARKTLDRFKVDNPNISIIFGSIATSQWPQLLACGCVGGHLKAPVYLIDDTNLDSEAKALDCLDTLAGHVERLLFVGDGAGLRDSEKSLLLSAI